MELVCPLLAPVKSLLDFPVYLINSLPIRITPLLAGKRVALTKDMVVALLLKSTDRVVVAKSAATPKLSSPSKDVG